MRSIILLTLLLVQTCSARAETVPVLGEAAAMNIVNAATTYARAHAAPGGAIAVVDAGGQLIAFARLDGSFPAASDIAIGKARTAAAFRKPTRVLEDLVNKGRVTMTTLAAVTFFTPLKGGVPLTVDAQVVGAIGVSGAASADQDDEIAQAAADAAAAHKTAAVAPVLQIDAAHVAAAFERGDALYDGAGFKVNASRRDGPGEAELHTCDTDIFYIQHGSANLVSGGNLVAPREVAAGELRAHSIKGGTARRIASGEVVIVPRGVPHWFEQVDAPFDYFVVKSTS